MKKVIKIKPEGWIDTLIIKTGNWSCGKESAGMSISINDTPGGVLTRKDMKRLIKLFTKHLIKAKQWLDNEPRKQKKK